jgi:hypothetical protein
MRGTFQSRYAAKIKAVGAAEQVDLFFARHLPQCAFNALVVCHRPWRPPWQRRPHTRAAPEIVAPRFQDSL